MADKAWAPANLLDVFGDRVARAILVLAKQKPRSVEEIADWLDVSKQTVYRRVDELADSDLLREHHRVDPDGNQRKEYETIMDEVTFAVDADGYTVDVQVRPDIAGDFGDLWSDLEETDDRTESERPIQTDVPERDPV